MASAKKKAEEVQGTIESMPRLPGEGTQIAGGVEPPLDPIITGTTEMAQTTIDDVAAAEEKAALCEIAADVITVPDGGSVSATATGEASPPLGELPIVPVDNPADAKPLKQPPCEKCTQERPCSVECWVAAGYSADDYDAFVHKQNARTQAAAKSKAHHNLDERPRKFKVWEHGHLEIDGITHKSGAIIELHPHIAEKIACLEPHEE